MVGDVYDVGPLSASSVGLDIDVGLLDGSLRDRPLVLFDMSDGDCVLRVVSGLLLFSEEDPASWLSRLEFGIGCSVVLAWLLPPNMSMNRDRLPLESVADMANEMDHRLNAAGMFGCGIGAVASLDNGTASHLQMEPAWLGMILDEVISPVHHLASQALQATTDDVAWLIVIPRQSC